MKKYTKLVKSFLKDLGYDYVKVRNSPDMCADIENEKIFINSEWYKPIGALEKASYKAVKKLYKEYGWKIKVSMGTFAILHELGHVVSKPLYKDLDSELNAYTHKSIKILQKRLGMYEEMKAYRKIRLERDADRIAYKIYKDNKDIVIKYDKQLKELMGQ